MHRALLLVAACVESIAWAQAPAVPAPNRVYHFTGSTPSAQGYQELATVIRTVADARDVRIDDRAATIEFSGADNSADMAEWLLKNLDTSPDAPVGDAPSCEDAPWRRGAGGMCVVRLAHASSQRMMQETLTVLRVVLDVQKIFSYAPLHAIAMRGSAEDMASAEWILKQLDRTEPAANAAVPEYRVPSERGEDLVRVYHLSGAQGAEAMSRFITAIRTTGGIRKTFAVVETGLLVVRGTPVEMTKADGIITVMDRQLAP